MHIRLCRRLSLEGTPTCPLELDPRMGVTNRSQRTLYPKGYKYPDGCSRPLLSTCPTKKAAPDNQSGAAFFVGRTFYCTYLTTAILSTNRIWSKVRRMLLLVKFCIMAPPLHETVSPTLAFTAEAAIHSSLPLESTLM